MKKGSLNLSVNSIVVFVLAFALLSVGLGFTYMFRERGEAGLGSLLSFEDLKEPASASKPITIDREININRNQKNVPLDVGYYNKDSVPYSDVTLQISSCYKGDGTAVNSENLPVAGSIPQHVSASEGVGYRIMLTEKGLTAGTYICKLGAQTNISNVLTFVEEKQFYLNVGS